MRCIARRYRFCQVPTWRLAFLPRAHTRKPVCQCVLSTWYFPCALQEIFPDAEVEAAVNNTSEVAISSGGTQIVQVKQRDLYRKYYWPAAPKIKEMLEMYKSEVTG